MSEKVEFLVLATDDAVVRAVEHAIADERSLYRTSDVDEAVRIAEECPVGVLVTDLPPAQLGALRAQLLEHAPAVMVIAVGQRNDGNALLELTNEGEIFRFLLAPVPAGQLRLFIEGAIKRHKELKEGAPEDGRIYESSVRARPNRKPLIIGAAAGLGVAALAAGLLLAHLRAVTAPAPNTALPAPEELRSQIAANSELQRPLIQGRQAWKEGKLVEPPEDNALHYFSMVLAMDPNHAEAGEGVNLIVDLMFDRAEAALDVQELAAAEAAITIARRALPGHPRLAYLESRLDAEQQRALIEQAIRAADRGDFEAAQRRLAQASQLRLGESPALAAGREAVARRLAEREIATFLGLAADRLEGGKLLSPPKDSARFYLESARAAGASDDRLEPLASELAERLLRRAQSALTRADLETAAARLSEAWEAGASEVDVAAVEAGLGEARATNERRARLFQRGLERLDQDRLITPENDSARHYLLALRAEDPGYNGLDEALERLGRQLIAKAGAAMADGQLDTAREWLDGVQVLAVDGIGLERAEQELQQASIVPAEPETPPVRRKYVPPEYPEEAQMWGVEGWVHLEFTVAASGAVENVTVRDSSPRNVFERAAVRAVEQWKYKPARRGKETIEHRTEVKLRFALD